MNWFKSKAFGAMFVFSILLGQPLTAHADYLFAFTGEVTSSTNSNHPIGETVTGFMDLASSVAADPIIYPTREFGTGNLANAWLMIGSTYIPFTYLYDWEGYVGISADGLTAGLGNMSWAFNANCCWKSPEVVYALCQPLQCRAGGGASGGSYDDINGSVSFTAQWSNVQEPPVLTPEPSALLILLVGLMALVVWRWRRLNGVAAGSVATLMLPVQLG